MTEDEFKDRTKQFALRVQWSSLDVASPSGWPGIEGRAVSPKPPQPSSFGGVSTGRTFRRNVPTSHSASANPQSAIRDPQST